jgi:hypothetical protein
LDRLRAREELEDDATVGLLVTAAAVAYWEKQRPV